MEGRGEQDETHKLAFHRRGSSGPERCNCNEQHARSVPSRLCCALVPRCVRSWAGAVVARAVVRLWCTDAAAVSRRRVRCFLFPSLHCVFAFTLFFLPPTSCLVQATTTQMEESLSGLCLLLGSGGDLAGQGSCRWCVLGQAFSLCCVCACRGVRDVQHVAFVCIVVSRRGRGRNAD